MKRIYEVEYEEKWPGCEWVSSSIKVAGNGNALDAVAKTRKYVLGLTYENEENNRIERCKGFRLLGISLVAQADIW